MALKFIISTFKGNLLPPTLVVVVQIRKVSISTSTSLRILRPKYYAPSPSPPLSSSFLPLKLNSADRRRRGVCPGICFRALNGDGSDPEKAGETHKALTDGRVRAPRTRTFSGGEISLRFAFQQLVVLLFSRVPRAVVSRHFHFHFSLPSSCC